MHRSTDNARPSVSVVMSVYNAEQYIAKAIQSILNQTFNDFELLIVDDASTDSSLEIVNMLALQDGRIKVFHNSKNQGVAVSRNRGLLDARGRYIAIQDADDLSLSSRLKKESTFLDDNPDTFLVACGVFIIDKWDRVIKTAPGLSNEIKLKERLERKNALCHSSVMFRNEGLLYREKFPIAEDYDFFLRILSAGKKIKCLNEYLVKYRIVYNSTSFVNQAKTRLLSEMANKFYFQRLKNGKDEYKTFDPASLMNIDVKNSTNRTVISSVIRNSFIFYDFEKTREFCKKYFSLYGYSNKYLFYYILSFLGEKAVSLIVRFTPLKISRFFNES